MYTINKKNTENTINNFSNSDNKNKEKESISSTKKNTNNEKNKIKEIKLLEEKLEKLEEKLEKEKDKFLRLFAEFENYKKRIKKEKLDIFSIINEQIIIDLIPILDDFERGIKELKKEQEKSIVKGISLIQNKLIKILKEKGLDKIKIKKGDEFNTDIHEAITQIPTIKENLKGKIIDIIEDGYVLKEKVIRHAKVITGK
ncbi:nucleotide exchange factor GrpE [Blattabacterium cuenoti]|uniref:nucleotide exchange factor GrpE n=1 Tax=Blattabacterium cuenoti TaxID=1653831 RepID=UPI00163D2C94|nr:nucleotide exchange factor GrpE [Blattabacterium cuenoti]